VSDISIAPNGVKWFATDSGLYSFNNTNWQLHPLNNTLGYQLSKIRNIEVDDSNNVWGVALFGGGSYLYYNKLFKYDGINVEVFDDVSIPALLNCVYIKGLKIHNGNVIFMAADTLNTVASMSPSIKFIFNAVNNYQTQVWSSVPFTNIPFNTYGVTPNFDVNLSDNSLYSYHMGKLFFFDGSSVTKTHLSPQSSIISVVIDISGDTIGGNSAWSPCAFEYISDTNTTPIDCHGADHSELLKMDHMGNTWFYSVTNTIYPDAPLQILRANSSPVNQIKDTLIIKSNLSGDTLLPYGNMLASNNSETWFFTYDSQSRPSVATLSSIPLSTRYYNNKSNNLIIYPNPSSNITTLSYTLSISAIVNTEIVNLQGQVIKTLASELHQPAGEYKLDITDDLVAGVYFIKTVINGECSTKPFVRLAK